MRASCILIVSNSDNHSFTPKGLLFVQSIFQTVVFSVMNNSIQIDYKII